MDKSKTWTNLNRVEVHLWYKKWGGGKNRYSRLNVEFYQNINIWNFSLYKIVCYVKKMVHGKIGSKSDQRLINLMYLLVKGHSPWPKLTKELCLSVYDHKRTDESIILGEFNCVQGRREQPKQFLKAYTSIQYFNKQDPQKKLQTHPWTREGVETEQFFSNFKIYRSTS